VRLHPDSEPGAPNRPLDVPGRRPAARLRLTLVGPAFPWRGGIPLLTADLAHRLTADGSDVVLHTWSRQGPARLLPAQRHPLAVPESRVYPTTPEPLSWRNPMHWRRLGRQAGAGSDVVVLIHYTTLQAPALHAVAREAGRRARVVVICANAVPHEPRPGDRPLVGRLMRSVDGIVVHTAAERRALAELTDRPVAVATLPPHLPAGEPQPATTGRPPLHRLLFFGKVRPYKGVDVLLRALARIDGLRLDVVGEFYRGEAELRALTGRLGLTGRIRVEPGYLPAERIPAVFAGSDALVLPYRTATASQLVALAHRHGLPAVATRVGNFPDTIRDGVDGLLCAPGDVDALERALRALYQPGRLGELRAGVRSREPDDVWRTYLDTLYALAGATVDR
jgi:glycosyltransferase involved in cell wall biosynthesis